MPVELAPPVCLHVPPLTENESAMITWSEVDGASGYRLERYLNGFFHEALPGRSWLEIDQSEKTWSNFELMMLSWLELETLPPNFVVYDGEGLETPTPSSGLKWEEIDRLLYTWQMFEAKHLTWEAFEQLYMKGLTWTDMEARWLSWQEFEQRTLTWSMIEALADNAGHVMFVDQIPRGAKTVIYRVLAYNDTLESDYRTTGLMEIAPQLLQEDNLNWEVDADKHYLLQIDGTDVDSFDRTFFTVMYDKDTLQLLDVAPLAQGVQLDAGEYPEAELEILSNAEGRLELRCTKPIEDETRWEGFITLAEFLALQTCETELSLR